MKIKDNKGITLIALVITIIVLLIIAGITITSIMGDDSTLEKSTQAKSATYKAKVRDEVSLALLDSNDTTTGKIDDTLLENNIKKISGFSGDITKEVVEGKNEFNFTIDGYNVKIDKDRNIIIDGEYTGGGNSGGNSGGGNSGGSGSEEIGQTVISNELVYDRGTFGDGWEFYTEHNYGSQRPQINADNYNLGAGSSFRVLYTKTLNLEQYTKAYFVVDNVNTISRISISEAPENVNYENLYYRCDSNNTIITQQEDGLYLIEWDISSVITKGKIAMSAWNSEGNRKLYKMYLEKKVAAKEKTTIYNYGTISNGYTLSSTHDFSTNGQVITNEDNYEIKTGSGSGAYSVLYTNDINFANYDYFCTEIDNINTLDRIYLRKNPYEINHGSSITLKCSDAKNQGKVYIERLENGRYLMRVYVKNINQTLSIVYDTWDGDANRKIYKIWLEKER